MTRTLTRLQNQCLSPLIYIFCPTTNGATDTIFIGFWRLSFSVVPAMAWRCGDPHCLKFPCCIGFPWSLWALYVHLASTSPVSSLCTDVLTNSSPVIIIQLYCNELPFKRSTSFQLHHIFTVSTLYIFFLKKNSRLWSRTWVPSKELSSYTIMT